MAPRETADREAPDADRGAPAGHHVEERKRPLRPLPSSAAGWTSRSRDASERRSTAAPRPRRRAPRARDARWSRSPPQGREPGELALRREGDSADPRAAVAGHLADEDEPGCPDDQAEVRACSRSRRSSESAYWLNVAPIHGASVRRSYELQRFQRTTSSCARRRCEKTLVARSQSGSSAGTADGQAKQRPSGRPESPSSSRKRASSSTGTP